jgi:hypothetical protein
VERFLQMGLGQAHDVPARPALSSRLRHRGRTRADAAAREGLLVRNPILAQRGRRHLRQSTPLQARSRSDPLLWNGVTWRRRAAADQLGCRKAPVTARKTPTYESTCKRVTCGGVDRRVRPPSRSRRVPRPASRFPSVTAGFALRRCTGRTGGIIPSGRSRRMPGPVPSRPHGRPCAAGRRGLGCRSAALRGVQNQRPTAWRTQPLRPERGDHADL